MMKPLIMEVSLVGRGVKDGVGFYCRTWWSHLHHKSIDLILNDVSCKTDLIHSFLSDTLPLLIIFCFIRKIAFPYILGLCSELKGKALLESSSQHAQNNTVGAHCSRGSFKRGRNTSISIRPWGGSSGMQVFSSFTLEQTQVDLC